MRQPQTLVVPFDSAGNFPVSEPCVASRHQPTGRTGQDGPGVRTNSFEFLVSVVCFTSFDP